MVRYAPLSVLNYVAMIEIWRGTMIRCYHKGGANAPYAIRLSVSYWHHERR